jgi:diguanylate cyclase (GGDEF)-like protein/PAS domain S-box-containing protein
MSILALFCLLFALLAAALLVLYVMQRRQRGALEELTRQLHRIVVGGPLRGRVELATDQREVTALVTVLNHLLTRTASAAEPQAQPAPPAPVSELGDRLHEAVLIHGKTGILYSNPQFAQLIGAQPAELVGRRLEDLVPPEYAELVGEHIRHRLAGEAAAARYEVDLLGLQGQHARLELSAWPIEHAGQRALLIVGVEVLPTQTVAALGAPSAPRSRARAALEALPGAVVTVDLHGRVEYLNPAAAALVGVPAESAAGLGLDELARHASEVDRKLLAEPVHQALTAGTPLNLGRRPLVFGPESAERLVEVSAAPLRDEVGDQTGAVLLLHDVTESRGLTRQISYQAAHDALTGLVNRREFERRLQEAVEGTRRGDGNHVLCYLDLDRFKAINDTSGHQAGDSLLRDIAKLVRGGVRDSDTVGRLGGDEFGLLLMGCPLDKARQIADDVCRKVADHRFVWRDRIFNVGASIGLVEISKEAASIEEVLAAADSACYQAKRQGNHVTVYSARDELAARQSGEIHWLQLLQSALKEHRFELYCQPIVAAYGDGDAGPAMEVLVRLRNEAGEHVSPADFLQAAERYRLMGLIDRQIVQTALDGLGRGAITLPANRSIGINISGQTLADAQFLEFVVECFDATGANPAQVCFEIAESAVIANMEHARRFIGVLHGMGCRFALDNFGSGLGSFSNLKFLAVDFLKIDGSFMRNLARDSVNQAMVTAMIKLARTLNFKVIAEQVEDSASVDAARAIGVDYMQGYALGRPAPLPIAA